MVKRGEYVLLFKQINKISEEQPCFLTDGFRDSWSLHRHLELGDRLLVKSIMTKFYGMMLDKGNAPYTPEGFIVVNDVTIKSLDAFYRTCKY